MGEKPIKTHEWERSTSAQRPGGATALRGIPPMDKPVIVTWCGKRERAANSDVLARRRKNGRGGKLKRGEI